jgi:benzylsuccinate CoA-transferase BbsE subunit
MDGNGRSAAGALSGLRVLDLADGLGAYASRLLGDLGADVIRVEPPSGSTTRRDGANFEGTTGPGASAFDRFVNAGKRSLVLDLARPEARTLWVRLVESADVLIETLSAAEASRLGVTPAAVTSLNPRLVHASVTPFGRDRSDDSVRDDDLTIMAAGGLLHLGGYPDGTPVVAYGGQAQVSASLFTAVSVLVGLIERLETGLGTWIDVSAQESVAQALEDTVPMYELTGVVRQRLGADPREAGSGMYPCLDGAVAMVAGRVGTARAWQALVTWLVEEDVPGATELLDGRWSDLSFRQTDAAIARFGDIFSGLARSRTRMQLYEEAQRRGIALSPVNDIRGVLADPQLVARNFWVRVADPELGVTEVFPGPPYRLSATPARPARSAPRLGDSTRSIVVGELGVDPAGFDRLAEAGVI